MRAWRLSQLMLGFLILAQFPATGWTQSRFPRVYGPTGHTYGPTQAHYQYERQYGRPWHGYGGNTSSGPRQHHVIVPGAYFPSAYGYYGAGVYGAPAGVFYGGYGAPWVAGYPGIDYSGVAVAPAPGLSFYAPGIAGGFGIYGSPGWTYPQPNHDLARFPENFSDPLAQAWQKNLNQWGENLPGVPVDPATRPIAPSSTANRLKGLEAQGLGDQHVLHQEWSAAYQDYKKAVSVAPDLAEAHWRMGMVLIAMRQFDSAAASLKRAVYLQPNLVQTAPTLAEFFGPDNILARNSIAHALQEYVREDIRNPDRLFVLGVWLHTDQDQRSREVFEAGLRMAGRGTHFLAYLNPEAATTSPAGNGATTGTDATLGPAAPIPSAVPSAPTPQPAPTVIPQRTFPGLPRTSPTSPSPAAGGLGTGPSLTPIPAAPANTPGPMPLPPAPLPALDEAFPDTQAPKLLPGSPASPSSPAAPTSPAEPAASGVTPASGSSPKSEETESDGPALLPPG